MVVCKFFQQGSCRYGQSCRFEHSYASKYSYHAPAQQSSVQSQGSAVSDEQLVNQVQSDVQAALQGGQWILSCYSPFKEKPILPGLTDLSLEEARLFIYEAKANNTIDQAVVFMNNLFKENRTKYQQLLQPTSEIKTILRNLYKGDTITYPFSNNPSSSLFGGANNTASSIFQSAVQTSPFAAQTSPSNSIFGSPNKDPAQSIFAQATQNVFGTNQTQNPSVFATNQPQSQSIFSTSPQQSNVFGAQIPDTAAKSIFAQASQSNFGQTQQSQPQNLFAHASQQIFGQNQNTPSGQNQNDPFGQKSSDPFGQKQNEPFGQNASSPFATSQGSVFQRPGASIFEHPTNETGIYSNITNISETDLSAFKAKTFKLGFVPEMAPPIELCT